MRFNSMRTKRNFAFLLVMLTGAWGSSTLHAQTQSQRTTNPAAASNAALAAQYQQLAAQIAAAQGNDPIAGAKAQAALMQMLAAAQAQGGNSQAAMLQAMQAQGMTDATRATLLMALGASGQYASMQAAQAAQQAAFAAQGPAQFPSAAAPTAPVQANNPSQLGPKKPGMVHLGVMAPEAQMGQGSNGPTANVAEQVRSLIIATLSGPLVEVVPITSMIAVQADAEIKQKECDYLLYTSISQKKTGGGGFLKHAAMFSSLVPGVSAVGGVHGMIAGAATSSALSTAGGIASTIKAKDEVTFSYKVAAPGSATPVLSNSATAKAKNDGDDIVTPLLQQAANAIVTELTKKK